MESEQQPKYLRKVMLVVMLASLVIITTGYSFMTHRFISIKSSGSVEVHVTVGMKREKVRDYLESAGIEHSWDEDKIVFTTTERGSKGNFKIVKSARQVIIAIGDNGLVSRVEGRDLFTGP